jgi:type IV pilus assembly protein PilM
MAKKITTLFLRDNSVNVAVFDGKRVEKWATGQLEPGLVNQGMVTDQAKVASAIRDVFRQNQLRGGKVVAGMSGANSLYRMITLPEMPDALLGEAVRREVKRVLPVSLDEVNLSFQAVPSVSKGEKRLFLATYPKAATEALVKTLKQAGLEPYLMDLAPLALGRVPDEARCVIVNVRANYADIIVIEDRIPQLIRVLSLPAEATSLDEKLPAVTEELSRTVIFYNSSHAEKPLNDKVPLFVCGELASEKDSWQRLVGRLNFPVAVLAAPFEHGDDLPADDFLVNMGLALKEMEAERAGGNSSLINFNVLPQTYQPKRVPVSTVLLPVVAVVGAGVLAYMASFVYRGRSETASLRDQAKQSEAPIATQTQRVASLKSQVSAATPLVAPLDTQATQIHATAAIFKSTASGLQANRTKVDNDLSAKVVGLLPESRDQLSLTAVAHDGSTITITGTAASEVYVLDYTKKLRASGAGIVIATIQANTLDDGTQTYIFNVTMR